MELLEVDEAIAPDGDVGAVVREERGLDKGARAYLAHDLLQQLEANVDDLLVGHRLGVEAVVVLSGAAGPMAGLHQLRDVGIIPGIGVMIGLGRKS